MNTILILVIVVSIFFWGLIWLILGIIVRKRSKRVSNLFYFIASLAILPALLFLHIFAGGYIFSSIEPKTSFGPNIEEKRKPKKVETWLRKKLLF